MRQLKQDFYHHSNHPLKIDPCRINRVHEFENDLSDVETYEDKQLRLIQSHEDIPYEASYFRDHICLFFCKVQFPPIV